MGIEDSLWNFPCTHCGSNDRVAQQVVDADKREGKLPDRIEFGVSHVNTLKVMDVKKSYKPGDRISVLQCLHDYCARCGTNYCFRITLEDAKVSMNLDNLIKIPPIFPPMDTMRGN